MSIFLEPASTGSALSWWEKLLCPSGRGWTLMSHWCLWLRLKTKTLYKNWSEFWGWLSNKNTESALLSWARVHRDFKKSHLCFFSFFAFYILRYNFNFCGGDQGFHFIIMLFDYVFTWFFIHVLACCQVNSLTCLHHQIRSAGLSGRAVWASWSMLSFLFWVVYGTETLVDCGLDLRTWSSSTGNICLSARTQTESI